MKSLIVFALLLPGGLLADQGYFFGKNLGEAIEHECDSKNSSCYEKGQLTKTHHQERHHHKRHKRHYHQRPYHPRPHYPNQHYYYNPRPNYYPQQQYGNICRNGYYYCGMNYPAPLYTSCYCNLGYTFFYGTVTNY